VLARRSRLVECEEREGEKERELIQALGGGNQWCFGEVMIFLARDLLSLDSTQK